MSIWVRTFDGAFVNLERADKVVVRAKPGPGRPPVPVFDISAHFAEKAVLLRKEISEDEMNEYMVWLSEILETKDT